MGKGILLIVVAAILGGAMMMYNSQKLSQDMDTTLSEGHESQVLARELARSGVNVAVGKVHQDWSTAVETINTNLAEVEQEGGSYTTAAAQLSPTAIDVDVAGTYGEKTYRIKRSLVLAGPLDAPLIVDATQTQPAFPSDETYIDGEDHRPSSGGASGPPTAMNKPGIRTGTSHVRNQFGAALGSNINRVRGVINDEGDLGGGSLKAGTNWEVNLDTLYTQATQPGTIDYTLGNAIEGGELGVTYGTSNNPVIVHVPVSTIITGNVTGYGMLVVDGSLDISGSFNWEGIVLVRRDDADVNLVYGGDSKIYGSLIIMQRGDKDWAFEMPTKGRLKVTYKYSSAGFGSEVWVEPWGEAPDKLFNRGSNRTGDNMDTFNEVYAQGTRMNFFINVEGCPTATTGCITKQYWNHYAAGHDAPNGKPYAEVQQIGDLKWEIRFEDLPTGHPWEDWDYNDQVIEVEIVPEESGYDEDPWWSGTGGSLEEGLYGFSGPSGGTLAAMAPPDNVTICHMQPGNPVTPQTTEVSALSVATHLLHGDYLGACTSGGSMGHMATIVMTDQARVFYSAEAIARLGDKIDVIKKATRVIVVDQWEGGVQKDAMDEE